MSEGRAPVWTSRVEEPRTWRKPRIAKEGSRTIEIEVIAPPLDLGGANRSRGGMPSNVGN